MVFVDATLEFEGDCVLVVGDVVAVAVDSAKRCVVGGELLLGGGGATPNPLGRT